MKIIFLHGIGDGDPKYEWLEGLNHGLAQAGHPEITPDHTIAPRYSSYLKTDGVSAKMPPITYRPKNDFDSRRDFERRQADVQRMLRLDYGVPIFGFNRIPDGAARVIQNAVIDRTSFLNLDQVRRYVREESVRGAVLNHILDHLPTSGDVMIIGHSLGSVIAIDLLDHLHEDLHVRRFITIGSPANVQALHEGSERLLKKFPYSRVDDWSNLFNVRDIVTGGRGLASSFPGAQDFLIDCVGHDAPTYLGHRAVAGLVAKVLYPSKALVPATSTLAVRMSDAEASTLLSLHFADAVRRKIKDPERADRYGDALQLIRDDVGAQLLELGRSGQLLAPEVSALANGELPPLPHRWELHEAVRELTVLALTNCVAPYEIEVGNAPRDALQDIAVEMGFTRSRGAAVGDAIDDVQRQLSRKGGVPWGRVLTAAAGVAIVAAGPLGLAMAAPASAFGAAALTGGLAALGPGGMVGGLVTLGGLAGTGAAVATGALTAGGGPAEPGPDLTNLILRVSVEHARKRLDLPHDDTLWYHLADFESNISAEFNRLEAFNDPKSPALSTLRSARTAIGILMRFMIENRLSPLALEAESPEDESKSGAPQTAIGAGVQ